MKHDLHKMFRRDAADTSIQAALSIYPDLRELQVAVMIYARQNPSGFTDEEMNAFFDTHRSTFRARRAELMQKGFIVDSGRRSKMTNGKNATVWILPEYKEQNGN